ncbi:hypothetical protein [Kordiimonas marina]|uniref:hypothetical protein n=1 Tax=Kordiimonas marina TaxID=2872312 RepID=UPI001FF55EB6|nr:hypothetical protein [Kordiimonas marina]MCJ9428634.1 hypothetical protein [Kordiimonas marina]
MTKKDAQEPTARTGKKKGEAKAVSAEADALEAATSEASDALSNAESDVARRVSRVVEGVQARDRAAAGQQAGTGKTSENPTGNQDAGSSASSGGTASAGTPPAGPAPGTPADKQTPKGRPGPRQGAFGSRWNALALYFSDPFKGVAWLMGGFGVLTFLYVMAHLYFPTELQKDCWYSNVGEEKATPADGKTPDKRLKPPTRAEVCKGKEPAIYPSHADFMTVIFDTNRLLGFFSTEQINSIKGQIDAYLRDQRDAALEARAEILGSIADTAAQLGALSGPDVPSVSLSSAPGMKKAATLPTYEYPLPPKVLRMLVASGSGTRTPALNAALAQTNLDNVTHWLLYVAARYGVTVPNWDKRGLCYGGGCTGLCVSMIPKDMGAAAQSVTAAEGPSGATHRQVTADRLIYEIQNLSHLCRREQTIWSNALSLANNFGDNLGFGWLHLDSGWWVAELIFLSWVGVIANTLVAILTSMRAQRTGGGNGYDPQMFLMILPKLVLAPIMAIVVAALVVAGLTDGGISLANAKMFLVFGFISGFASERFTTLVRAAISRLMPRLEISEDKLKAQTRWVPPPKSPGQARTVAELRGIVRQTATESARNIMKVSTATVGKAAPDASAGTKTAPAGGQGGVS